MHMTTTKEQADGYFGLCPHCHNNDGYINIGRSHWFVCDEHDVMWCVGSNLFGSWREQTEDEQRAIYDERGIGDYTEVKPYFHPQKKTEPLPEMPGNCGPFSF
jgi:hypothetical protein